MGFLGACWRACVVAWLIQIATQARADVFRILDGDDDAMWARVQLAHLARHEINVAVYAVSDGVVPLGFLALLRDAADRGIRVRLLVDGMENDIPSPVRIHLRSHGVRIREFHPLLPHRPDWINRRLHDKLLVVDGCHMIVGSRNLDDRHFGQGKKENFVERDAYVRGESAASAQTYFTCRWNSSDVRKASDRHRMPGGPFAASCDSSSLGIDWDTITPDEAGPLLSAARDAMLSSNDQDPSSLDECWLQTPGEAPVTFLYDPPGAGQRHAPGIEDAFIALVASGQHEILIETPFLILSPEMYRQFILARARGVSIRVLTNSLASADKTLPHAAYENDNSELLRLGIELWELAGPDSLHAKSMVVDGRLAVIGSYNFDIRSQRSNSEVAVLVDDAGAAAWLSGSMEQRLAGAFKIGPDGKPLGAADRYPGVEPSRIRSLRRHRLLAPLVRGFL